MVRAGAFDDVDIAITWHPAAFTGVDEAVSLANTRIDFTLHRAAPRTRRPRRISGRSALDAVELMNVGVNYMREHMPSRRAHPLRHARCRRHRAERGAGHAPRCATLIRAREPAGHAAADRARASKIADGAALMTETPVETEGRQRGLEPARQHAARAGDAATAASASARRRSTTPTARMRAEIQATLTRRGHRLGLSPRRRAARRRQAAVRLRSCRSAPRARR